MKNKKNNYKYLDCSFLLYLCGVLFYIFNWVNLLIMSCVFEM